MIHELLGNGEQNARTAKELARAVNMEIRDVMQVIRLERLAGNPICSSCKGYFLPDNGTELKNTIIRLYKQAKETKRVAEAMQRQCKGVNDGE